QRQVSPPVARLHGIDQSRVTWVNIEPAAKVPALAERRVNAVADYTTGMPFYEKAMGKGNAVMMPWSDHGFDMYSMSIIASEKTMKERAGMLRAFLEASYMGWRDVMENPKSALEIFKKRVPEIDLSIMEPNMMMGLELMKTERYAKNGIGWMDDKKMCASVELVHTYMGVRKPVDCKEVYTNELLTKSQLPSSRRYAPPGDRLSRERRHRAGSRWHGLHQCQRRGGSAAGDLPRRRRRGVRGAGRALG